MSSLLRARGATLGQTIKWARDAHMERIAAKAVFLWVFEPLKSGRASIFLTAFAVGFLKGDR